MKDDVKCPKMYLWVKWLLPLLTFIAIDEFGTHQTLQGLTEVLRVFITKEWTRIAKWNNLWDEPIYCDKSFLISLQFEIHIFFSILYSSKNLKVNMYKSLCKKLVFLLNWFKLVPSSMMHTRFTLTWGPEEMMHKHLTRKH